MAPTDWKAVLWTFFTICTVLACARASLLRSQTHTPAAKLQLAASKTKATVCRTLQALSDLSSVPWQLPHCICSYCSLDGRAHVPLAVGFLDVPTVVPTAARPRWAVCLRAHVFLSIRLLLGRRVRTYSVRVRVDYAGMWCSSMSRAQGLSLPCSIQSLSPAALSGLPGSGFIVCMKPLAPVGLA